VGLVGDTIGKITHMPYMMAILAGKFGIPLVMCPYRPMALEIALYALELLHASPLHPIAMLPSQR